MSRAATRLLLWANRALPRPALPGRTDPASYARWEHMTSEPVLRLWRLAGLRAGRVLDLGCGLGGKTHALHEQTRGACELVALDLSLDHLRKADAYHRLVGLTKVPKVAGDAARLPFADGAFDAIVTSDTLEHLPKPQSSLAEMRRCVTPNGRVLLMFNPWGSPRGSHLADLLHLPWAHLWFSRDTLREAALAEAHREAARAADASQAAEIEAFGASLVEHFEQHVHPTRIADLRRWVRDGGAFAIERELRVGPGPLRHAGACLRGPWEEWLTASFGVVLRPL